MQEAHENSFWSRVLAALRDMGITQDQQTEVAAMLKIKQPSVWEWTDGGQPSMRNAVRLAQKLGVCVEWLLTGRGQKRPVPVDPLAEVLWEIWNAAPELREKIVSFAKFHHSESSPFTKEGPTKKAKDLRL